MTDDRSYRCPSCRGIVSIPDRRRTITIEQVQEAHLRTCPGHGVTIKEEQQDDSQD